MMLMRCHSDGAVDMSLVLCRLYDVAPPELFGSESVNIDWSPSDAVRSPSEAERYPSDADWSPSDAEERSSLNNLDLQHPPRRP